MIVQLAESKKVEELSLESGFTRGQTSFFDNFSILIENRNVGELVFQVQSDENRAILVLRSVSPCLAAMKVDCAYFVS